MNKKLVALLAVMGACNQMMKIVTPLVIGLVWVRFFSSSTWGDYVLMSIALIAALFRGVEVFLKE